LSSALALLLAANILAQPASGIGTTNPSALRVLILSGGEGRDLRSSTFFLRQLLAESRRCEARICESPVGITAETFAAFDVVVDDYSGPRLGRVTEEALAAFVDSGKGLVVTRAGLVAAGEPASPSFVKLVSASRKAEGTKEATLPFQLFDLTIVRPEHPIMSGLKKPLRTADRPPVGLKLSPAAAVLATTDKDEPLLFASGHGKGRVFCTVLGHDLGSMQEKAFITTFLRGTEWAASGKVTLPEEIGLPGPATNGVRLLVITGGHDHEASFYGLFDGWQDIGWAPVTDSKLAFQQDIRPKYDVLIFYDFTRDLDDNGKKNLRDFVESGKGIVVLHHGILNFQKWPWWYEEVVGGLYRLERQGAVPNSTVKFGEEHVITPVGDHPITAGIGPFHLTDETYKGLFISPNIKPLLVTDNPTSDPTVAWIGPCTSSKVVFIQLGHDHSPFRHPSYRALVHNSILWTAGKLK
jgi:type 1 glutamine amidotransferase